MTTCPFSLLNTPEKENPTCHLLVHKFTILVYNALREVDISFNRFIFSITQQCTENRNLAITLDGKLDIFGRFAEVLAVPFENAYL